MLVYDCEIINRIPEAGGYKDPRYTYCDGWKDFQNMGISVIAYGCINTSIQITHSKHPDFSSFQKAVNNAERIMGFNSKEFDDKLCAANNIQVTTTYDLLEEVRIAAYGSPNWEDQPEGFSYSLGAIAKANKMSKTGSGTQAPKLWQQGLKQDVITYCINDVRMTANIYLLGIKGVLIDPNTGVNLLLPEAKAC